MSDFKEDPSEWAESDEREIRPDAIVLRGQEAQEAARAALAWAGHITAEQLEAAARALYENAGGMTHWPSVSPRIKEEWLRKARRAFSAAGFTVVGEGEEA